MAVVEAGDTRCDRDIGGCAPERRQRQDEDGLLLHADGVTKRFGGLIAVNDIDFTIPTGSIVSLIGPNGAGKTTFFNIIAGLYDPTTGVIEFSGRKMIARNRRAWLEPFIWFLPGFIGMTLTLARAATGGAEGEIFAFGGVTLVALMSTMLLGVARPVRYQKALPRIGIFRSARPNDMVEAGLGRTFQNIRLFQNMIGARERARRRCTAG